MSKCRLHDGRDKLKHDRWNKAHTCFHLFTYSVVHPDFSICVAWRVFYKKQELLTLGFFGGSVLRSSFWFTVLCCVVLLFCLSSSCILCAQSGQCLQIVHSWSSLRVSLTFIQMPNLRKCIDGHTTCRWSFIFVPLSYVF